MSGYLSYELQTYANGAWKIESIYDDREIALHEAQRLQQGGRYSGLRVVEERFEHRSGNYVSKTVFRAAKTDHANAETLERRKTMRTESQEVYQNAGSGAVEALPQKSGPGPVALMLRLSIIVLAGIGMIVGVRYLYMII